MQKLQLEGPTNLNSAREYYEKIICGNDFGLYEQLNSWSLNYMNEINKSNWVKI